jgi:hypothetical protein
MEGPLLTVRAALVFLLAVLSGGAATVLALAGGEELSRGALAGLAATALAVPFFNRLIERDQERDCRHTPEREEVEGRG